MDLAGTEMNTVLIFIHYKQILIGSLIYKRLLITVTVPCPQGARKFAKNTVRKFKNFMPHNEMSVRESYLA